ncbi:hypothetical protein M9Y10_042150 [Tritrichomonas musculus]|uniref:DUF3447 domain-containing protein n=1 Tax=Tritrichomonas musculus TaxID=1915356 RepID=A0ABR2K769_9EUKA
MSEQNFEIRIGSCTIQCNKEKVIYVSEVISKYINTNPDAQFMNINLSYFDEELDKDFVYNILNGNDAILIPGREKFFSYFCTELNVFDDSKSMVQLSSSINSNNLIKDFAKCEEKLLELNKDNFGSTLDFFKDNDQNNYLNTDKYSIALLILNCCFARPFEIERYMKFLCELTFFDQKQIKSRGSTNENNLFDAFMKCFSIELREAFLSSAEYQNIDELFCILRYLYENSKLFKSLLTDKNYPEDLDEKNLNFLLLYYHGKYNMISFNSLKPLFIERVSITDFEVYESTEKYAENYDQIKEDNFLLHNNYAHIGINSDPLARLIIFDDSEKLEKNLSKAYSYMIEHSHEINKKDNESNSQNSTPNGSYIASFVSNNNYSVIDQQETAGLNDQNLPSFDEDYNILIRDVTLNDNDIKEIASRLSSPYRFKKSIYERCSFLNNECTLLEYAAFRGSTKCFKMLLNHSLEKEEEKNNKDYKNFKIDLDINSHLADFAVAGGSIEIISLIKELINKPKTEGDPNIITFSDSLEVAIKFHQWTIAETIIEENSNKFKFDSSLLNNCIRYSNIKTLIHLIQNNVKMGNDFLLDCFRYGNFSVAKWSLDFATKDLVNHIDIDNHTNILHNAVILKHKPLLSLILEHRNKCQKNASYDDLNFGVGINMRTGRLYRCSTALHLAVEDNNYEFTKMILDNGIIDDEIPNYLQDEDDCEGDQNDKLNFGPLNIELKNLNTLTPFHIACKNGNFEIVKLFLDNESYNVDINAETAGILLQSKWIDIKAKTFIGKTARELSTNKDIQNLLDKM